MTHWALPTGYDAGAWRLDTWQDDGRWHGRVLLRNGMDDDGIGASDSPAVCKGKRTLGGHSQATTLEHVVFLPISSALSEALDPHGLLFAQMCRNAPKPELL